MNNDTILIQQIKNENGEQSEQAIEKILRTEDMKKQINLLEKEKAELLESNKKYEEAAKKSKENEKIYEDKIVKLKVQLFDNTELIQSLNDKIDKYESESVVVKNKIDSMKIEIDANLKSIYDSQILIHSLNDKIVKIELEKEELQNEIDSLKIMKNENILSVKVLNKSKQRLIDKSILNNNNNIIISNINNTKSFSTNQINLIEQSTTNNLEENQNKKNENENENDDADDEIEIIDDIAGLYNSSILNKKQPDNVKKSPNTKTYNTRLSKRADAPNECRTSRKSFSSSIYLNHKKIINIGKVSYTCQVCRKRCTNSSHLKSHMLSHTGEKPFKCKTCIYECTTSHNLKKHMLIHTAGEKESNNLKQCKLTRSGLKNKTIDNSMLESIENFESSNRNNRKSKRKLSDVSNSL